MFKKILCLVLCVIFVGASFVACAEDPDDVDTSTDTETTSTTGPSNVGDNVAFYDPDLEHKVIVSDIQHHSIVIFDLNYCDGDWKKLTEPGAVEWEWCADTDPNCKRSSSVGVGIDEAKLRWSDYYQKEVIIACSSAGWAGIIDYQKKTVLWEAIPGDGPHSVELLPNGDLAVACAGDGTYGYLRYYPVSQGTHDCSGMISMSSAHGVCWDPDEELLWVLWAGGISAVQIAGYGTAKAKPMLISGMTADTPSDNGGHDLMPVFGQPGKYWASGVRGLWLFDSQEMKISKGYTQSSVISIANVKGNAYFTDNTFVQAVAAGNTEKTSYEWSTHELRVITMGLSSGKVKEPKATVTKVWFNDREFYKAHALCDDYQ